MTAPQNNDPNYDPLAAAAKRQSVSFKRSQQGERRRLQVQSLSREAQQADYDTGKPAFWPSDVPGQQGNPKMAVVFDVFDEEAGEPRALWCPKPSSMLNAVAAAQSAAGVRIQPGGILEVWIDGYKPSNDPKKEDQKLYKAEYTPGQPADPLASSAKREEHAPPSAAPIHSEEPPFMHRTGYDVDILRGDAVVV
jgi:hypothetical protein